jgi:hypothetical protein
VIVCFPDPAARNESRAASNEAKVRALFLGWCPFHPVQQRPLLRWVMCKMPGRHQASMNFMVLARIMDPGSTWASNLW